MTEHISLPRHSRRIPKAMRHYIINHDPGMTMHKPKVETHVHDYAVMDAWGQAMADMKKHGTWPDMSKGA